MNRLREWRELRGLSQAALAALLDVSPATVYRWERDDMTPRRSMRARIAKRLRVTVADLGWET